ncbi:EF-hand calcium-binding domain-containing protein 6 isoform X1 [Saccopteryx leptura]|uniref:EF-hand calcium-binding domain-containing protein 6 isoform X1 n=2 Tax=Saccopteryx leptura TaxID=249018 RepID=UPI00339D2DA5
MKRKSTKTNVNSIQSGSAKARDLMCKMAIIPDWHTSYPLTQKSTNLRPHSSPCRVYSRSGFQNMFRPSTTTVANPILSSFDVKRILFKKITEKGDELKKAFQLLDTNHTQTVSKSELRRVVSTFLLTLTREQFQDVLAQIPLTSSGAVPYLEFLSRFGGIDLNINVTEHFSFTCKRQATEMRVAWAAESLLAGSQQEGREDFPSDHPLSSSEDEGASDGERKHHRLLEAISSLGGKTRWKWAERSEASLEVSEFAVSSEGSGERLVLSDLLKFSKTPSSLATVKKQLNRVKSKKTVELPFDKEEAERIHREMAFNVTSQALSKWDPIVLKNRQAEQLVFPLEKEQSAFACTEHVLSGWEARTPLEREVFHLLNKNKQPVADPLLTAVEKASLKAMSLEEAQMRRAELQRARALQSYYEARARREKKIKSKRYRRVLKKGKAKKALAGLGKLWKARAPAALGELETLEKARMMERMSLKHQNSGKWAKSKAVMAKYDLEARQAVQEQLARNKELTQKLQVASENEEEAGGTEEEGDLVPVVKELQMTAYGLNPWVTRSHSSEAKEAEIQKGPEPLPESVAEEASEGEGEERQVAEEEILLKEFEERQSLRKNPGLNQDMEPGGRQETKGSRSQEVLSKLRARCPKLNKDNHQSTKQKVSSARTVLPVQGEGPAGEEEEPLLLQALEELEELDKGHFQNKVLPRPALEGQQLRGKPAGQPGVPKGKERKEWGVDLQNIIATRAPSGKALAVPTLVEELEDDQEKEQKQMIKEAFAGDDVIRDFLKEKREAVEVSKTKDMDLTLPGWGEWGGMGLKPNTKKRHRFLIKAPEAPPRKDRNLPNVILSEKRNIHAAAHQVRVLPYPFTHHQQFERTIQTPVGSTWNSQRAFQVLTAPKVITKPGHIIKPIRAENVGYRSSSRSDLSVIQTNPKRLSLCCKKQLKKN